MDYIEKIYTLIYTALATQSTIALPKVKAEVKDPYAFIELLETSWQEINDEGGDRVVYRGSMSLMINLYFRVSQDTLFAGEKRKKQSQLMRILEKALGTLSTGTVYAIGTTGDNYNITIDDLRMDKDIYDVNNTSTDGTGVRYLNIDFTYYM